MESQNLTHLEVPSFWKPGNIIKVKAQVYFREQENKKIPTQKSLLVSSIDDSLVENVQIYIDYNYKNYDKLNIGEYVTFLGYVNIGFFGVPHYGKYAKEIPIMAGEGFHYKYFFVPVRSITK